jgi:cell volume regulation protein A
MAYFLTISLTEFAKTDNFSILDFSFHFLYNLGMGFLIGLLLGYVAIWSLKLLKLKVGLSPVWVFMLILFTFSATELLHANSFLAVYVVGIVIGNFRMNNAYLANFFEGIAWLMEILLFLALGLQVFLQDLPQIAFSGLVVSLILIFIARPLGVLLSWSFFPKISWQKRFYVSWVGLRGATPIVFALYPIIHQVPEANLIFNITFFVVLSSVVIQGFTVSLFAKWLKMNQ